MKVCEGYSKFIEVTSGVPHGSVLGPVLLLYINDCLNGLSCYAVIFVDDVEIWRTIESSSDVQRLQNDINLPSIWPQGALMIFNVDRCVVLRLHPQHVKNNNHQYQLNGKLLRCVSHQRDLGVIVDETLKPNRQCANVNPIMRTIKALVIDITPAFSQKLYGLFIRPHLEYSFHAWRPWLKKDIKLLEDVQRRSLRTLNMKNGSNY